MTSTVKILFSEIVVKLYLNVLSSVLFTDIISVILFHTDSAMAIALNVIALLLHCTVGVNFAFEM